MLEVNFDSRFLNQLALSNDRLGLFQTELGYPESRRTLELEIDVTPELPLGNTAMMGQAVHPKISRRRSSFPVFNGVEPAAHILFRAFF